MKKISICLIVILSITNQIFAQKLKIKGSDTMLPLTQMLAEEYMKRNIDASIIISGGGSVPGITALQNGTIDIAESAREITPEEKKLFEKAQISITDTIIAYDALAVIVNPSNQVSQLTMQQLEAIFTGNITNWKDLGGSDAKIVIYSREASSGTYDFFKEHVLNSKAFAKNALCMPATGAIAQSVSQDVNAIGYVGLAYLDKTVKPIKVSGDKGNTFVAPSVESVTDKSYPISRPLYYIFRSSLKDALSPYIEFVLSASGQKLVLKSGYVSVK
jgi:phosphate transport system substrate-binding protein